VIGVRTKAGGSQSRRLQNRDEHIQDGV